MLINCQFDAMSRAESPGLEQKPASKTSGQFSRPLERVKSDVITTESFLH